MKDKEELLKIVVSACEDRKAENCIVLNMDNLTPIASYFLICHGNSERQVQAIARSIKEAVEEKGYDVISMEGFDQARWVLIDLNDIVCHVFHKDDRLYYNLERLWGDAEQVTVGENLE